MDNYIPFVLIPFIGWGVWHHLKRKDDLTPLKKRTWAWGIGAFFLTEMGRSFYRPYIYEHGIDDVHVADTIGNSLGTVTAIFMIITLAGNGTSRDWLLVGLVLLGLVSYELLNLTGNPAFDLYDVYATLVFGTLSIVIYTRLLRRYGSQTSAHLKNTP